MTMQKSTEPKLVESAPETTTAVTPETTMAAETTAPDPFDLSKMRLDQSFVETSGVKKLLTTVPVGKPNPQDFMRVHSSPDYRETLAVVELKEDREFYVLYAEIARDMPGEYFMATLYAAINRQGVVRIVPVKLPGPDGKVMEWHRSMAEFAERAMTRWVRVKANMSLGAYEMFEASATIPIRRGRRFRFGSCFALRSAIALSIVSTIL